MPPDSNRKHLPWNRRTTRWHCSVGGHKLYLDVNEYSDGTPGAIFIDAHKQGGVFRGLLHTIAQLTSLALQYGVPLRKLVKAFRGQDFEPKGIVYGHETITEATSVVDFVFHVLEDEYLRARSQ